MQGTHSITECGHRCFFFIVSVLLLETPPLPGGHNEEIWWNSYWYNCYITETWKNKLAAIALACDSGCDTFSYSFGKGQVSAINVMMKQDNTDLTSEEVLMETGRHLFCLLYGAKICTNMTEICHMLFTTEREKCSNQCCGKLLMSRNLQMCVAYQRWGPKFTNNV